MSIIKNKRIVREERIANLIMSNDLEWKEEIAYQIGNTISTSFPTIADRTKKAIYKGLASIKQNNSASKVSTVSICFLRSSLYTKTYDFCVSFFGEGYYKNEFAEKSYFSLPEFFNIEFDQEIIRSYLLGEVVGVRDYQLDYCVLQFCYFRLSVIPFYLPLIIQELELEDYSAILLDNINILYGGYMDTSIEIGKYCEGRWVNEVLSD